MMISVQKKNKSAERGAVSLFIVIFTALLITTITIGFTQLMMRDQQQASYSDLSESAYDSAVAGVEDAKRALLAHRECADSYTERCDDIRDAIDSKECTTLSTIIGGGEDETLIQQEQSGDDEKLNQAYTCVIITPNTDDYLGSFDSANTATLIPLRGTESFDKIRISWYQSKGQGDINLLSEPDDVKLPPIGESDDEWPENRPSLLRAQLINREGNGSFNLSDFDDSGYSNTLFLAPSSTGVAEHSFASDARRAGGGVPRDVKCEEGDELASGDYACKVTLVLRTGGSISPQASESVFLNLAAFYRPTDYKVELISGDTAVPFRGVQPEVDSTGRANDLFRRVVSRVEIGNTFNYPVAALETSGDLCKHFQVTMSGGDYRNRCEP